MIMNVFISHFSLRVASAGSFQEIKNIFEEVDQFTSSFDYSDLNFYVANDFLKINYYGQTIETQLNNFSYGDKQALGNFRNLFFQKWFKDALRKKNTQEMIDLSLEPITETCVEIFKGYVPYLNFHYLNDFITNESDLNIKYDAILSEYPIDNENWYKRATSRFKNVIFHPDCLSTINRTEHGFCNFSKSITKCITALNSYIPTVENTTKQAILELSTLTEYACTVQGKNNAALKFTFTVNDKNYTKLNCEFHLKPSKHNNPGDSKHYHNRIYFGFLPISETEKKIAIASIGPHIK